MWEATTVPHPVPCAATGTTSGAVPSPQSTVAVWVSTNPGSVNDAVTNATPPSAAGSDDTLTTGAVFVTVTVARSVSLSRPSLTVRSNV